MLILMNIVSGWSSSFSNFSVFLQILLSSAYKILSSFLLLKFELCRISVKDHILQKDRLEIILLQRLEWDVSSQKDYTNNFWKQIFM